MGQRHGLKLECQIWDTSVHERFRAITRCYFTAAMCVMLGYDITDFASFENIYIWVKMVTEYAPEDLPFLLVGNKCDLESRRKVPKSAGVALAARLGCPFFETSAKTGHNVDEAFDTALLLGLAHQQRTK